MNEKHGPNGFLLGLVIGGAVGALVSTQRGRQILKDLADYGLEYVGKTIDMDDVESILNGEEERMYDDELDMTRVNKDEFEDEHKKEHQVEHKSEPPKRRLFRGIRKK
jgi:uncharacterized protein YcfJ